MRPATCDAGLLNKKINMVSSKRKAPQLIRSMFHNIQAAIPNITAAIPFVRSGVMAIAPPLLAGALEAELVGVAVGE